MCELALVDETGEARQVDEVAGPAVELKLRQADPQLLVAQVGYLHQVVHAVTQEGAAVKVADHDLVALTRHHFVHEQRLSWGRTLQPFGGPGTGRDELVKRSA